MLMFGPYFSLNTNDTRAVNSSSVTPPLIILVDVTLLS